MLLVMIPAQRLKVTFIPLISALIQWFNVMHYSCYLAASVAYWMLPYVHITKLSPVAIVSTLMCW